MTEAIAETRGILAHLESLLEERETATDAASYKRSLSAAVRGLWSRVMTPDDFFWSMGSSIDRGLARAWALGAAEGGLVPAEFTQEEQTELKRHILSDRMRIGGFEQQISSAKSKEEGGLLRPHLARVELWVNHWWEVYALARAMASKNKKMVWRLGATKVHCRSCAALSGRIYRNSVWLANVMPQSSRLVCGGWRCRCSLQPTTARITPGRFPRSVLK